MREMQDTAGSAPKTLFKTSSQVGKTTIFENVIGYHIHLDPCPMLMLNPTLEMSETFSKDRFDPMIRDTPVITDLVVQKSRDGNSTILHKKFRAGHLTLAGANSPASLASRPVRGFICDEIARFPLSAGDEGSAIDLGERRTARFWNAFQLLASTPKDESDEVEFHWQYSDQRKFFVACPHCNQEQVLIFGQLKWEEGNPKKAWYECEHCQEKITEKLKAKFLSKGKWRPTNPSGEYPGYHIWEAYVPTTPWSKIASAFVKANRGGRERLQVFVNTVLGEAWKRDESKGLEWSTLMARAEPYQPLTVPMGGLLLIAGCDTQDNRLSCSVWAIGRGEEIWAVYATEIYGDPAKQEVWDGLLALLDTQFTHAGGAELKISACAIDTRGHHTQDVYNFVRKHPERGLYAIAGSTSRTAPVIAAPSFVEVTYGGKSYKRGVRLWPVGVYVAKSTVQSRLRLTEPGPGFIHFPIGLDQEFYEQLCAEKLESTFRKGFETRDWVKTRPRNERFDELVYAYAISQALGVSRFNWARLESEILPKTKVDDLVAAVTTVVSATSDDEHDDSGDNDSAKRRPPPMPRRGSRRNFATSY